jgi:hypothetical protein
MSWGSCASGSNNIHFGFPPIMTDGRNYSSWQPGGALNANIRKKENITTNWQYRKFLTENADSIIATNQLEACNQCCSCPARYDTGQSHSPTAPRNTPINNTTSNTSPFLYKSCTESTEPYGYESSDLKDVYLSEYKLQSRLVTPVLTQEQLLKKGYVNYN